MQKAPRRRIASAHEDNVEQASTFHDPQTPTPAPRLKSRLLTSQDPAPTPREARGSVSSARGTSRVPGVRDLAGVGGKCPISS